MRLLLLLLACCLAAGVLADADDAEYVEPAPDYEDAETADVDHADEDYAYDDLLTPKTMKDRGIPLTIEEPSGYHKLGIRYHLAHFGSVPYGQEFPRYGFMNASSVTAVDRILSG